jgi:hypothetical protein
MDDAMDTMVGGGKQDTESVPSEDVPLAEIQPEVDVKQQEQEKEEEKQEQAQAQPVNSQKPLKVSFKDCYKLCSDATAKFFSYVDTLQQVVFSSDGKRMYFISAPEKHPVGLYCVPINTEHSGGPMEEFVSGPDAWTFVSEPMIRGEPPPSRAQEYRNERRRKVFLGMLGFDDGDVRVRKNNLSPKPMLWIYEPFLLKLLVVSEVGTFNQLCPPIRLPPNLDFLDHKVCPYDGNLIAAICKEELFVLEMGPNPDVGQPLGGHRLTKVTDDKKKHLSAGSPSFCTMEEFDRFTGYWWQPKEGFDGKIYKILFDENDESQVMNQYTFNPNGPTVCGYKYPDAGTDNSKSTPKLLEFWYDRPMESGESEITKCVKKLPYELRDLMPDHEYMVRCGWLPNGEWVYLQLLNRRQTELRLIILPCSVFCLNDTGNGETSVDSPPSEIPMGFLVLQEHAESWINIHDVFEVIYFDGSLMRCIWLSESTGFHHLELVEARLSIPPASMFNRFLYQARVSRKPLTSGPWVVMPTEIWVDKEKQLVYFHGNKETPLEQHLYVVSYEDVGADTPPPLTRITAPGYSHSVKMNESCTAFYDNWSSFDQPPQHSVYSVTHDSSAPQARLLRHLTSHKIAKEEIPPHRLFSFTVSTGEELHGIMYHPKDPEEGKKYPTIVYVYGGPRFQLVKNSFPYTLRYAMQWTQAGFCVVMLDNRGAYYRGKAFEQHIDKFMGKVEVEDQVAGLEYIAKETGMIDLMRVGVTGWSYGGYMSLMCLAKRPDVFKVAISGAPVTLWLHYDTGYTERYLGQVQGDGKVCLCVCMHTALVLV